VAVLAVVVVGGIVALAVAAHHEATKPVTVRYRVTGNAHGVSIAYSTWDNQTISTARATASALPWSKQVTTTGFVRGGALTVKLGASGGTATCSATVDTNGRTYTATATGPFATAQCRGF
jgi:dienelactone hydrolase